MIGWGDEQTVFFEQFLHSYLRLPEGQIHHRAVQVSGHYLGEQAGGGGGKHLEPDIGVGGLQCRQHYGDQPSGGGVDDAQSSDAGDVVAHGGHVIGDGVGLGPDAPGPGHHRLALLGEGAGVAVHQPGTQFLLQPGDVLGHVGLDGVQRPGRAGECPVLGYRQQGVELADVHGSSGGRSALGSLADQVQRAARLEPFDLVV